MNLKVSVKDLGKVSEILASDLILIETDKGPRALEGKIFIDKDNMLNEKIEAVRKSIPQPVSLDEVNKRIADNNKAISDMGGQVEQNNIALSQKIEDIKKVIPAPVSLDEVNKKIDDNTKSLVKANENINYNTNEIANNLKTINDINTNLLAKIDEVKGLVSSGNGSSADIDKKLVDIDKKFGGLNNDINKRIEELSEKILANQKSILDIKSAIEGKIVDLESKVPTDLGCRENVLSLKNGKGDFIGVGVKVEDLKVTPII